MVWQVCCCCCSCYKCWDLTDTVTMVVVTVKYKCNCFLLLSMDYQIPLLNLSGTRCGQISTGLSSRNQTEWWLVHCSACWWCVWSCITCSVLMSVICFVFLLLHIVMHNMCLLVSAYKWFEAKTLWHSRCNVVKLTELLCVSCHVTWTLISAAVQHWLDPELELHSKEAGYLVKWHQSPAIMQGCQSSRFSRKPPDLRSILRLYDMRVETPDFSHVSSIRQRWC